MLSLKKWPTRWKIEMRKSGLITEIFLSIPIFIFFHAMPIQVKLLQFYIHYLSFWVKNKLCVRIIIIYQILVFLFLIFDLPTFKQRGIFLIFQFSSSKRILLKFLGIIRIDLLKVKISWTSGTQIQHFFGSSPNKIKFSTMKRVALYEMIFLFSLPRPHLTVTTEDPSACSPSHPRSNPRKKRNLSLAKKHREIREGPRAPAASRHTIW